MLIELVKKVIPLFSKNNRDEWQTEIFYGPEELIKLPASKVVFKLSELYE